MESSEVLSIISKGESSRVQFKERMPHVESMAQELVAFSNSEGGLIIFGVNDKTGDLNGLSFSEIASINNQLTNIATNNVLPPVFFETETVTANGNNLVVVTVPKGSEKPYKDRSGNIYMKVGSDKRKVTSNNMIAQLLQSGRTLHADETVVQETSISDVNLDKFKAFVKKCYEKNISEFDIPLEQILENLGLMENGMLTLAGLLFFGEMREKFRPMHTVQCVKVNDVDIACDSYEDIEHPIKGTLDMIFEQTMGFIDRNMQKIPKKDDNGFNSHSKWEIPKRVFEEFVVNALIHRDYFISSSVRVLIFQNRVEIISPGSLPNTLTVENIKNHVCMARNPILHSIARYVLPYIGLGSGISRAYSLYPHIEIENSTEGIGYLKVTIMRNVK